MVGFDNNIYNIYITIGASVTSIELTYGFVIANMKETPLIYGDANYIFSTANIHDCGMTLHAVSKSHREKMY